MKNIILFIFAIITISLVFIPLFIYGSIKYKNYIFNGAYALDRLGAWLLYNRIGWTVSSLTYYLRIKTNKKRYIYFEKLINFIFQDKHHCINAYYNERKKRISNTKSTNLNNFSYNNKNNKQG